MGNEPFELREPSHALLDVYGHMSSKLAEYRQAAGTHATLTLSRHLTADVSGPSEDIHLVELKPVAHDYESFVVTQCTDDSGKIRLNCRKRRGDSRDHEFELSREGFDRLDQVILEALSDPNRDLPWVDRLELPCPDLLTVFDHLLERYGDTNIELALERRLRSVQGQAGRTFRDEYRIRAGDGWVFVEPSRSGQDWVRVYGHREGFEIYMADGDWSAPLDRLVDREVMPRGAS
jgi:hypothetical protein